jgi:ElaB/YqjD/DUF883 family membrane-anchored ribosome-binding protein
VQTENWEQENASEAYKTISRLSVKEMEQLMDNFGQKVNAARTYLDYKTQQAKDSFNRIRQEGFEELKKRASDQVQQSPLYTLLAALGAGVLIGWLTKRGQ